MSGIKRKAELQVPITDENDLLKITPLGSGNEVGRSSILLEYKGKTILVGCKFFSFSLLQFNYHTVDDDDKWRRTEKAIRDIDSMCCIFRNKIEFIVYNVIIICIYKC